MPLVCLSFCLSVRPYVRASVHMTMMMYMCRARRTAPCSMLMGLKRAHLCSPVCLSVWAVEPRYPTHCLLGERGIRTIQKLHWRFLGHNSVQALLILFLSQRLLKYCNHPCPFPPPDIALAMFALFTDLLLIHSAVDGEAAYCVITQKTALLFLMWTSPDLYLSPLGVTSHPPDVDIFGGRRCQLS